MAVRRIITTSAVVAGVIAAGGAVPALAAPVVPVPARVAASDPAPLTVESVRLSHTTVTVQGRDVVMVEVTARLRNVPADGVSALLVATPAPRRDEPRTPATRLATLTRVSGTAQDGVYSGVFRVHATMNGTWTLAGFGESAMDMAFSVPPYVTARTSGPTLQVRGSHAPRIVDAHATPLPKGRTALTGRVVDATTGRPYDHVVPVATCSEARCVDDLPAGAFPAAARTGQFRIVVRSDAFYGLGVYPSAGFQHVLGAENLLDLVHVEHEKPLPLRARPATSSVRAGRVVRITGSSVSRGAEGVRVQLQRQYSCNTWRTVNSGVIRTGGAFTLAAQPPRTGTNTYRVQVAPQGPWARSTSRPFVIRGR